MQRLDRFISENSSYTRSQIKEFAKKGRIILDGAIVKKNDIKIDENNCDVICNGEKISKQGFLYVVMNKPKGYVCATEDRNEKTVTELLPPELQGKNLAPAGRLDKDTTGLLLLTNDGDFAHKLISPKHHTSKHYLVTLARDFEDDYIEKLKNGIVLSDGTECLPAYVNMYNNDKKKCVIKLTEGKYHQVKRMFAALGNHVESLKRISIGNFVLPIDLPLGKSMVLLHKEEASFLTNSEKVFSEGGF
jgi:16S rRNA pseudouridine516 synthase